jgi:hypothetical protein
MFTGGWISPQISEFHVPLDRRGITLTRTCGDLLVRCRLQPNVSCKLYLMPNSFQRRDDCARQIGVDQQAHAELGTWQWVK